MSEQYRDPASIPPPRAEDLIQLDNQVPSNLGANALSEVQIVDDFSDNPRLTPEVIALAKEGKRNDMKMTMRATHEADAAAFSKLSKAALTDRPRTIEADALAESQKTAQSIIDKYPDEDKIKLSNYARHLSLAEDIRTKKQSGGQEAIVAELKFANEAIADLKEINDGDAHGFADAQLSVWALSK